MPRRISWCELLSFTNTGCVYNAACHYMSRFTVNDGGYMYMHLVEWRMKDLKRKPTADLQQRELICQALVGYFYLFFLSSSWRKLCGTLSLRAGQKQSLIHPQITTSGPAKQCG